ncbi:MAG: adenylyl-sulfate reductase subunit alpha [Thermoleophilia bacterium]|nr:adenylyl-sulfate reductase subunit alpha [Thermoleophilia bacterium]
MEQEKNEFRFTEKPEVEEVNCDILIIGGGMSGAGAAFEACRWATPKNLKVVMADKAAVERSGAVAQGLSAINTYIGENDIDDYVRYVRADLMGIIREDLVKDLGRMVDDSVHLFEQWGLPIWKKDDEGHSMDGFQARDSGKALLKDGGTPVRSGKWQIMINGESYKAIVGDVAKKSLEYNAQATGQEQNLYERVFCTRLLMDANEPNRIAGAIGFSTRENKVYVFKANAVINGSGGAVNVFRPRSVGEGLGRAWFPVWNSGSGYAMGIQAGAELTLMENRFVPMRFKDGYGPVGAWFLFFKAKATNAIGEDYCDTHADEIHEQFAPYDEPMGTALRNHAAMVDMKAGLGPIMMHTDKAMQALEESMDAKQIKHLEAEAWEDFLDMTIAQAGLWAANDVEPNKVPSELMPSEPYLLGSHAGCAGFWVSGPGDIEGTPDEWSWGYNRMSTVNGLFMSGDVVGASGHKFSSGSHAEGRIAGKMAVAWCLDHEGYSPAISESIDELVAEIYAPMELYAKYKSYTTAPENVDINPNYIRPRMLQFRLMKIMDEYVGGVSTWYTTSATLLAEGLKKLEVLKEDSARMAASDLHELLRCWENYHRIWAAEAHARHINFREESRYPGYYYRGDFPGIDDANWKCFTNSRWTQEGGWEHKKVPYVELVPAPTPA